MLSAVAVSHDPLTDTFGSVRIINLAHRADRRRETVATLANLGAEIDGTTIAFHDASRPDNAAGFPTIGTRGCFLSHLGALKEARDAGVSSLLILEDDVAISRSEMQRLPFTLAALEREPWDIFYGGSPAPETDSPLSQVMPGQELLLTHFIAFSSRAINGLVPHLEAILTREPGSPDGGPMHVDGAYAWFRAQNPDMMAYAATPHIAHQRSSRTDVHDLGSSDTLLKPVLGMARSIKNAIRNRK